jgi:hypothetical protein
MRCQVSGLRRAEAAKAAQAGVKQKALSPQAVKLEGLKAETISRTV